ncbi:MAG TPA: CGNR zinc finger domain-containing protein [Solirubrobacterales bacterium]|nr:CGNR zinc finger domain-containing protein [Solirubrobacterales bacterium]
MPPTMERFGPTRRGGPVFRWLGEPLAIDLANTAMTTPGAEPVDLLATAEDLRAWIEAEGERLGEYVFDPDDLDEVRELRDTVRELLGAAVEATGFPARSLRHLNAVSAAAPIAPQLALDADGVPDETARIEESGTLDAALGRIARSAIELLSGPERERLKVCGAPSCGMFFLGARRWCCSACGNRARAARHYRRTRAGRGESQ